MRMLMNNLDEDVAEDPRKLIVYGGSGRAARSWEAFHAIVDALRRLENDETLLVQSGKPVGIFVLRSLKAKSGAGFSMFNMQPENLTAIIVPADDILKAAKQVPAAAEEKEKEKKAE